MLEAYPADTGGRKIPAANAYHGTLSMFESAGFEVVARRQFNRTTPVRPIVRLVSCDAMPREVAYVICRIADTVIHPG